MLKCLLVGDSHLKISILEDAKKYIEQLLTLIKENSYDQVILLGDQFDTFAIVRSEILSVWTSFFRQVSLTKTGIICLTGNHDMAGADGGTHPMEPFEHYENVKVVQSPEAHQGIYFAPFYRDNAAFEKMAKDLPEGSILFCHQSVDGCEFENGFYDPSGVSPDCMSHLSSVISGHIHRRQNIRNVWYPGTPFQHSFSDAGQNKFIHEINLAPSHYTITKEIVLDMPKFEVIKADTPLDIRLPEPNLNTSYKIIAKGTPSEISSFWGTKEIKEFKSKTKRVVDAMTSIRPQGITIKVSGITHKEKMEAYVKSKRWRTNEDTLLSRAKEYLA